MLLNALATDEPFMVKTKRRGFAMLFVEVIQMDLVQVGKFIAELRKEPDSDIEGK